jgi:hypothetical protein
VSETKDISVTVIIPDVESLSDEKVTVLARMRDGRWSYQTRTLLARFGTTKLDLNSAWASTWIGWSCPCCRREKPQIARLSPGGVLLCRLEYHHDHLGDLAKRVYLERNPRTNDQETNIQLGRAKDALKPFIERFEQTLICIDCNLAEGQAKLGLAAEIDRDFTFTPSEISRFINVGANRLHEVNMEKALLIWTTAKEDFADRIDFTQSYGTTHSRRPPSAGGRAWAESTRTFTRT